jgi:DNA-binding NtrC family response regulator
VARHECDHIDGVSGENGTGKELFARGTAASRLPSFDDARDQFSRDYLVRNLQSTSGNVSKSARLAKRNRTAFYKLLTRYRLQPDDYKEGRSCTAKKAPKNRDLPRG